MILQIQRRSYSNSDVSQVTGRKRKSRARKRKRGRKKVLGRVKAEADQSGDEEIEYIESDAEGDGEEGADSEEPELVRVKYVQPPLSEWIPRQIDKTTGTSERLRIFFVKTPEDAEETDPGNPQPCFKCPAYYTILNNVGFPVNRIKRYQAMAQHYQTPKKRV